MKLPKAFKQSLSRRVFFAGSIFGLGASAVWGLRSFFPSQKKEPSMKKDIIKNVFPIDFHWPTKDPFLFCAHHYDEYPAGNSNLGPNESLSGRPLGQDFSLKNGYRMYHGRQVPGFPVHPHKGFETVTLVRNGYVDHADSLGAGGRYGAGDVQWMTAGKGVQHSEMFPLVHSDKPNPVEMMQLWLNLPAKDKNAEANYKMFWRESIPKIRKDDERVTVEVITGDFEQQTAPTPPPKSWAQQKENDVAVWVIEIKPGGQLTLPHAQSEETHRTLYFYDGDKIQIGSESISKKHGIEVDAKATTTVSNPSSQPAKLLVLQGRPIGEPIAQSGPFVMNTKEEIYQAIQDYQHHQFGGWPWETQEVVHGDSAERFGKDAKGQVEKPG